MVRHQMIDLDQAIFNIVNLPDDIPNSLIDDLATVMEAARLVADPNIEAAFDAAHHILWIELKVDVSDEITMQVATRIVDAALTPGDAH